MKKFTDITNIAVGGIVCIAGVIVYKKLKDIHDEIIYFEDRKGIIYSNKEYDKKLKEWFKTES